MAVVLVLCKYLVILIIFKLRFYTLTNRVFKAKQNVLIDEL